jgi:hypothetical protein
MLIDHCRGKALAGKDKPRSGARRPATGYDDVKSIHGLWGSLQIVCWPCFTAMSSPFASQSIFLVGARGSFVPQTLIFETGSAEPAQNICYLT